MRCTTLLASLMLAVSPTLMAGQIYKWVDAQGVTHFDAQPPVGRPATTVQPAKPVPPPGAPAVGDSDGDVEQRAIDAKVKRQVAENTARDRKFCTGVRTNLATLKNNPRIRMEVDGEYKFLTQEERQTKIDEVQALIDNNCKGLGAPKP
ncbi:DUF4124 domain-containing protein [Pseudomonas sp. nanlin1]|uniref:DUF4124 domain-containing protein n=1 Tax=Pseudomonas sp. nanlin1 TaxID=3040605 RepID=UPI00388D0645